MWQEISEHFCQVFPILVASIIVRLAYVFYCTGRPLRASALKRVRTLIVLGSAATDNMSLQKACIVEELLVQQGKNSGRKMIEAAQFMRIYRSREVGQSYITSIWTTLIAIVHALWLTLRIRPQVIICNGPGTCIPLCVSAYLFKVLGLRWSSIFYVESIARVRKLSLSGLLLYKLQLADQFVVQWPQLQKKYPRAHYAGYLM